MTLKNVCIVLLALLLFTGCSEGRKYSKTEMVEGIVTLDGTPMPGAEVMFQPLAGNEAAETATGKANDDGVYRLTSVRGAPGKGTTAGEYGVAVTLFVHRKLAEPIIDRERDVVIEYESKQMIPLVYHEVETSPLRVTVSPGKNIINLELDSKAIIAK